MPKDDNLGRAVMQQKPVSLIYPNSTASKHFVALASELMNDEAYVEEKRIRAWRRQYLKC